MAVWFTLLKENQLFLGLKVCVTLHTTNCNFSGFITVTIGAWKHPSQILSSHLIVNSSVVIVITVLYKYWSLTQGHHNTCCGRVWLILPSVDVTGEIACFRWIHTESNKLVIGVENKATVYSKRNDSPSYSCSCLIKTPTCFKQFCYQIQ